ncbi:hypothetical protein NM208_g1198 [Fusarium decemcellulare]|uniref:Uncharacterized protein n=1 Tax=Fusarium decemcellulare TaxID=57161 RepID=A0ACC1SX86_9HYPO|nr:hypothetical protein NM208_g1198 [Fusarium decemcellulare]
MRLLQVESREIVEFITDHVPPYAILSHTWGEQEITMANWNSMEEVELRELRGYAKIQFSLDQATKDGLGWVWVDTCCIDKTSSAELSEAINSMFRWYQNATVCYAYLSDVSANDDLVQSMPKSYWFTRGWTLQELLAPRHVVLYSQEWQCLGTKYGLVRLLSSITRIGEEYLSGKDIQLASVAKRMSWASRRNTSRVEDIAYCLLGVFDINVPLIYGEGMKAFQRLQGEILRTIPYDHTLYAWGTTIDWESAKLPLSLYTARELEQKGQELWSYVEADSLLKGMLAESPRDFENSGHFVPNPEAGIFHRAFALQVVLPQLIKNELKIELPVLGLGGLSRLLYHWKRPVLVQRRPTKRVLLLCGDGNLRNSFIILPLKGWGSENYGRTKYLMLYRQRSPVIQYPFPNRALVHVAPEQEMVLQTGDFLFRRGLNFANRGGGVFYSSDGVMYFSHSAVVRADSNQSGYLYDWCIQHDEEKQRGWSIKVTRALSSPSELGHVTVSLVRVSFGKERQVVDSTDGSVWFRLNRGHEPDIEFRKCVMISPRDVWIPEDLPFYLEIGFKRTTVSGPPATVDIVDVVVGKLTKS